MISPTTDTASILPIFRTPRLMGLRDDSPRLEPTRKRFYVYFRPPLWLNKLEGRVMVMVEAPNDRCAIDVAMSSGVYTYVEPEYGSTSFVFDGVEPA